jgi:hypothetical protein
VNPRLRSSCLFLASLFSLSVAGVPLPTINVEALRLFNSDVPVAFQFEKAIPDHDLPGTQDLTAKNVRTGKSGSWERARERSSDHGLIRDLLHQAPVNPGFASKLDLCSEFTKPDSLVIRSMGTPKNHRSPPV